MDILPWDTVVCIVKADMEITRYSGFLACHHILLHAKIGIGNGPEILHPPLAEAAFCQLAVLGRLMAPE